MLVNIPTTEIVTTRYKSKMSPVVLPSPQTPEPCNASLAPVFFGRFSTAVSDAGKKKTKKGLGGGNDSSMASMSSLLNHLTMRAT